MVKTFDGMKVSEESKVPCAIFMLKEGAYDWWLLEKRTHDLDQTPYTWRMFKVSFYEKYFPRSEQIQRENEFLRLIHGSKTVAEYEAEFARLYKFAPTYVLSDEARARHFGDGLRPSIKKVVTPYELRSCKDVVNKALLVERTLNETQEYRENRQRKRSAQGNFHGQGNSHRENREGEQGKRHQTSRPDSKVISTITHTINVRCPRCSNNHEEKNCHWFMGACFACDKQGHRVADCPQARSRDSQGGIRNQSGNDGQNRGREQTKTYGRAYAITQMDGQTPNTVVIGTITVSSAYAYVLFDSSATHSFVSTNFAMKNQLVLEPSDADLYVDTL